MTTITITLKAPMTDAATKLNAIGIATVIVTGTMTVTEIRPPWTQCRAMDLAQEGVGLRRRSWTKMASNRRRSVDGVGRARRVRRQQSRSVRTDGVVLPGALSTRPTRPRY
jgi:hypothetical protein